MSYKQEKYYYKSEPRNYSSYNRDDPGRSYYQMGRQRHSERENDIGNQKPGWMGKKWIDWKRWEELERIEKIHLNMMDEMRKKEEQEELINIIYKAVDSRLSKETPSKRKRNIEEIKLKLMNNEDNSLDEVKNLRKEIDKLKKLL